MHPAEPRSQHEPEARRILGSQGSAGSGPTVIAIGALHGNEPAGLTAIGRVLAALAKERVPMRGHFAGVLGNRGALAASRRYLHRDLNRGWSPESCARTASADADRNPEDREQRELLSALRTLAADAQGPVVFVDLHSTSGPAAPFSVAPNMRRNRPLLVALPIPTVLGLDESIDGTLVGYLCAQGHLGLAIEGGQHDAPHTADLLEACVWFALAAVGVVHDTHVPRRAEKLARLRAAALGKPTLVEIKHRHGVAPDDAFAMKPGYANFIAVAKGETVAHDRRGPIRSPMPGLMMLPRYQQEGDDGFFIASPVTPLWLRTSQAARWARLLLRRRGGALPPRHGASGRR